jgi:hypothetical protein
MSMSRIVMRGRCGVMQPLWLRLENSVHRRHEQKVAAPQVHKSASLAKSNAVHFDSGASQGALSLERSFPEGVSAVEIAAELTGTHSLPCHVVSCRPASRSSEFPTKDGFYPLQ